MKRVGLSILLMVMFLGAWGQAPHLFEYTYPEVTEVNPNIRALMDRVSADSLEATIDHLQSYHTRRYDSRMVYEVQNWLLGQYQRLGFDSVYLHDFQLPPHLPIAETSDNVVAIQKGTRYPDEYVVCGAHYDSYNDAPGDPDSLRAPGADDNASGVSGILETARILSKCSFERSIIYVNFGAEEVGLVGSAAYARDCAADSMHIVGYFNLDMIGYLEEGSDIHVNMLYTGQDSTLARYVKTFSQRYYPEMRIWHDWLSGGSDSDYSSFNRNGFPAIQLFEDTHHSSPFIHTPQDVLGVSVNNMDQAKRFTELHLGLVALLAGWVSTGVEERPQEALRVFPNPTSGKVTVKGLPLHEIRFFNTLGQLVFSQQGDGLTEKDLELNVTPGLYILQILTPEGQRRLEKIVVN